MRWQYRTIVFEFQKDGLLGDRFIDDEDVENTLNAQGRAGWELVSATMVQEGLLTLFKRPDRETDYEVVVDEESGAQESEQQDPIKKESVSVSELQEKERDHIRSLEKQRRQAMEEQEQFAIGEIKIR